MNFPLSTFVNVAVQTPQAGVGNPNTSNVAIFTRENYQPSFGNLPFNIYAGGSAQVITDFGSTSITAQMAVILFSGSKTIRNGSNGGGYLVVIPFLDDAETLEEAFVRTQGLVQFFGILVTEITTSPVLTTFAPLMQGQSYLAVFPGVDSADWQPGGRLDLLRAAGMTQSRGIGYNTGNEIDGLLFSAGYITCLMSVDFTGNKTCQTMNLKTLPGILADPGMDAANLAACQTAGVDVYISVGSSGIGGSTAAKVRISTTNGGKVDDVYAGIAYGNDLQVAYFDTLAETNTKIPQTEDGMDAIKKALREVSDQYVTNGFMAPGAWNDPDTFGDVEDLIRNVADVGFYIYTNPIATQDEPDRVAGNAPLGQIAGKMAGAILGGNLTVNLNP